jgi:hypothetical protein
MSLPPNHGLRWVELSRAALTEALTRAAATASSIDARVDGYGFGIDLVREIAKPLGLSLDGESQEWATDALNSGGQRVCAQVINVKQVPAGEEVSYGGHFRTQRDTTLALISIGFADGVPRLDPVGGNVELGGTILPIAGRIAMDQLIVDATESDVSVGDVATIWGGAVSVEQWSEWSSRPTIEITSLLAPRVARVVVE